ncbi:unnamed protein product [Lactuca virosa]|uniref:Uncharacterized protein n=1 Tax=Lactuca virosa TaxID=75947 RepID=A0AAU9NSM9_9ASTR|nr:unnamed protein product [Lactuca virosa]
MFDDLRLEPDQRQPPPTPAKESTCNRHSLAATVGARLLDLSPTFETKEQPVIAYCSNTTRRPLPTTTNASPLPFVSSQHSMSKHFQRHPPATLPEPPVDHNNLNINDFCIVATTSIDRQPSQWNHHFQQPTFSPMESPSDRDNKEWLETFDSK